MTYEYRASNTSANNASRSPYTNTPLASTSASMSGSYYYSYLPESGSSNQSPAVHSSLSSPYQRYSTPTSNYPYDSNCDQDNLPSPHWEPSSSKIEHDCISLSSLTQNDITRLYLRDVPTSSGNVLASIKLIHEKTTGMPIKRAAINKIILSVNFNCLDRTSVIQDHGGPGELLNSHGSRFEGTISKAQEGWQNHRPLALYSIISNLLRCGHTTTVAMVRREKNELDTSSNYDGGDSESHEAPPDIDVWDSRSYDGGSGGEAAEDLRPLIKLADHAKNGYINPNLECAPIPT
ncbi:hypothetical protein BU17DRAFT_70389 [Hysterangium stoloniferum]|nr:hypothetical protein BU17DRAFT_70389 [Hysterangium stoloniferum]